jgi:dTDP-4-dehydrorhamnose reductase
MTLAILGAQGMLGQECVEYLSTRHPVVAYSKADLDITDPLSIDQLTHVYDLTYIINCAAYTNVDGAETHPEDAHRINALGPRYLAEWAAAHQVTLIHFSTDYIFSGEGETPYKEESPAQPINTYGHSKWEGEEAIRKADNSHYIFRIQWVYGQYGKNFVSTMRVLLSRLPEVSVVNDQIGSLTWVRDIAETLDHVITHPIPYGTYHLTSDGYDSWYAIADTLKEFTKASAILIPVDSTAFPRPAIRPKNSRLDCTKLKNTGIPMIGRWDDRLMKFIQQKTDK